MFERDLNNVKKYLEEIGAAWTVYDGMGIEQVYVFDKAVYDKKHKHPRKYKDLYVPYLRLSDHGDDGLYAKRDGYCEHMTDDEIKEVIDELTFG